MTTPQQTTTRPSFMDLLLGARDPWMTDDEPPVVADPNDETVLDLETAHERPANVDGVVRGGGADRVRGLPVDGTN